MPLPTEDALRAALEPHIAGGGTPGLVALAAQGDDARVVALGAMDDDGKRSMRRDAIFRIASMTKAVTAVAALMLAQDGRLALDEPVDRLLPELANRRVLRRPEAALDDTVPANRPITVEDLLTFRCGLGIIFGSPAQYPILAALAERNLMGFGPPDPTVGYGPDEYMRRLGELPLMTQPGEAWLYSAGSNILGVLIERAAGQPLGDFMQARIFEPLGMPDTGFFTAAPERLPTLYWSLGGRQVWDDPTDSAYARAAGFPGRRRGAGLDRRRLPRLLALPARRRPRGRSPAAAGSRRRRDDPRPPHGRPARRRRADPHADHGWGYGVAVATARTAEGVPARAYGWNGGHGTSWIIDPATQTTAILMTQVAFTSPDPPPVHKAFQRAVFG